MLPDLNLTIPPKAIDQLAARLEVALAGQTAMFWSGVWVGALTAVVAFLVILSFNSRR